MATRGRSISRPGQRTEVAQRIEDRTLQSSPGGKYLLYLKANHYWTVDLASGKQTNVTAAIATSFVDRESDDTGEQKPPFGVAGWTTGDQSVLLYDKLDIWEVKPDGSGATRLTNGAAGEIRHRFVRLDPDAEWIDRTQPIVRVAIRTAIEEIRLRDALRRAPAPVGDVAGAARQARRSTGQGEARRSIRLCQPGLRRFARLLHQRPVAERCHAGHDDQSVHARLRVGTLGR